MGLKTSSIAAFVALFLAEIVQARIAAPTTQSLDVSKGIIDVDYSRYLSRHDVVFNRPILNPVFGSTVGTGRVGAMVWNEDGLNMQISGIDASPETVFSGGLIHLNTSPRMDASYAKFQQRLSLYDGVLTIKYDTGLTVSVMGAPNSEVMGIHVADARPNVSRVTFELSLWDVGRLTGGDVRDLDTWRTVAASADATVIGLSRGQKDPDHFGYTLAATVEGADFTTQTMDSKKTRLTIEPSSEYTIWIVCASRLNAPDHDSAARARALLSEVETQGYRATLANYKNWWHAFWQKSFVQYRISGPDGDYLENLYYLYTYIIAAGSYADYPFHFINGDFTAIGDANSTRWGVAYWHWNERDIYNSFLASNHPEILHVYNRLFSRNMKALRAQTRRRYLMDGIWVPETMGWDGNDRHTEDSAWTRGILSTGAEVAENMYAEFAYTDDAVLLRTMVYPFVREVAQFYTNRLSRNAATGEYYLASSNAHETYWNVQNAITDLAAVRSLLPIAIRVSVRLNLDRERRSQWQAVLDNLAPYPLVEDGSRYAPHDPPTAVNHNWQNITSELIWPYGVSGIGTADYGIALNSWLHRPYPYGNIWSSDAVQAARLGLGGEAEDGLKRMINAYQTYPNGLTNDTNGRFEYLGTHLSTINESLLQSYDDVIRVFPAPPDDPKFVGRFTLLARGGFLVTAEYENKEVKYIALRSLYGHPVTVENPWGGLAARVVVARSHGTVLTTSAEKIAFETEVNSNYIIERVDRPLRTYVHTRVTGVANDGAKHLMGSSAVLGAD